MPMTPQDTLDDVQDTVDKAKKVSSDVSEMAQDQIDYLEDEVISFTQRKPLVAVLTALAIGVVIGKIVL